MASNLGNGNLVPHITAFVRYDFRNRSPADVIATLNSMPDLNDWAIQYSHDGVHHLVTLQPSAAHDFSRSMQRERTQQREDPPSPPAPRDLLRLTPSPEQTPPTPERFDEASSAPISAAAAQRFRSSDPPPILTSCSACDTGAPQRSCLTNTPPISTCGSAPLVAVAQHIRTNSPLTSTNSSNPVAADTQHVHIVGSPSSLQLFAQATIAQPIANCPQMMLELPAALKDAEQVRPPTIRSAPLQACITSVRIINSIKQKDLLFNLVAQVCMSPGAAPGKNGNPNLSWRLALDDGSGNESTALVIWVWPLAGEKITLDQPMPGVKVGDTVLILGALLWNKSKLRALASTTMFRLNRSNSDAEKLFRTANLC